jgi:hypothetical protein
MQPGGADCPPRGGVGWVLELAEGGGVGWVLFLGGGGWVRILTGGGAPPHPTPLEGGGGGVAEPGWPGGAPSEPPTEARWENFFLKDEAVLRNSPRGNFQLYFFFSYFMVARAIQGPVAPAIHMYLLSVR